MKEQDKTIDLVAILDKVPAGTTFYCPAVGYVTFVGSFPKEAIEYPIKCKTFDGGKVEFTKEGYWYQKDSHPDVECVLFPSQENRDWEAYMYDLPELTACITFSEIIEGKARKPSLSYYAKNSEVYCDGLYNGPTLPMPYIIPYSKYTMETGAFDMKDNYGTER